MTELIGTENDHIYKKLVDVFGFKEQSRQAMEEFCEAAVAASKASRFADSNAVTNLAEELADAIIMIEQMKYIYSISHETICNFKEMKLQNLQSSFMRDGLN